MGFAGNSISTNLARDLGTRIVAAIFFGTPDHKLFTSRTIVLTQPQEKKPSPTTTATPGSRSSSTCLPRYSLLATTSSYYVILYRRSQKVTLSMNMVRKVS